MTKKKSSSANGAPQTCIVPGCRNQAKASRGLCSGCYGSALKKIRNSQATWEELEGFGLAMPGKRSLGKFDRALAEARAKA